MAMYKDFNDFYSQSQTNGADLLESNRYLAEEWGVSEATIRRWRKKYAKKPELIFAPTGAEAARKALSRFTSGLPKPMEFFGSPLVTGDVHIPLTSQFMTAKMYEIRRTNDLSVAILGGDLFAADSLGRFDPKQADHTLKQEIDIGREYVAAMLLEFEELYIIKGNHEDRFMRAFNWKMDFVETMQTFLGKVFEDNQDRIHISNLDHMYVYGAEGQKYYVNHPKAYSRTPLATGRALASKHNCNIICAHAHHHAIGTDISGQYVVAEMGGLFDADKTAYLREATTFPRQVNGLVWLNPNGGLVAYNPLFEYTN